MINIKKAITIVNPDEGTKLIFEYADRMISAHKSDVLKYNEDNSHNKFIVRYVTQTTHNIDVIKEIPFNELTIKHSAEPSAVYHNFTPEEIIDVMLANKDAGIKEIQELCSISPSTFYKYKKLMSSPQFDRDSFIAAFRRNQKLNEQQVTEIYQKKDGNIYAIARQYNVNIETVRHIWNKQSWKKITDKLDEQNDSL